MTNPGHNESILRSVGRFIGRNSPVPALVKMLTKKQRPQPNPRTTSHKNTHSSVAQALATLDLSADTTDWSVIESRYRQLVKQYHPDRYAAQDLPPEMLNAAQSRFNDIQHAYQTLKLAENL